MTKTVLIAVANSKRELVGCSLVARYLASMGFKPVLCNRYSFSSYYERYTPEAVVWFDSYFDLREIARDCYRFVNPSESGNGQYDQVRATHGGTVTNPVYPQGVDRFLLLGTGDEGDIAGEREVARGTVDRYGQSFHRPMAYA